MTKDEALKLALEALEYIHTETSQDEDELIHSAITAIKKVLAQPEQEQVKYTGNGSAGRENTTAPTGFFFQMPKREWVGLTNAEVQTCWDDAVNTIAPQYAICHAIEAKLKEKNT